MSIRYYWLFLLTALLLVGIARSDSPVPSSSASSAQRILVQPDQNSLSSIALQPSLPSQLLKQEWLSLRDEIILLKQANQHAEALNISARMRQIEQDLGWRKETDDRDRDPLDQGGELCVDANVISVLPYCAYGNTTGFDSDYAGSCVGGSAPDVVYRYTAPVTAAVTVSLCGSSYDTGLHVWRGCPISLGVEVACNDDAVGGICGLSSCLTVVMEASFTYYIVVDGYSTWAGSYLLNITTDGDCHSEQCWPCPYPRNPVADNCADAIPLDSNPTQWGSTIGQYSESGLPWCEYSVDSSPGVWYKVTGVGRTFTISLCDGCTNFDTKLHVYSGSCGNFTCVVAGDDTPTCADSPLFSEVTWCSEVGVDYYILVSGYGNAAGDFTISFGVGDECPECEPLFNIPPDMLVTANTCIYNQNLCDLRPSVDIVAELIVLYDGSYTIDLCQTAVPWDSYIYLTTECCGGTVLASDDDGCGLGLSKIESVYLTAGSYYLAIEGYNEFYCGEFSLIFYMTGGSACCYGPPELPQCNNVTESVCDVLGGDWQEGVECTQGLCYSPSGCPPRSEITQIPPTPDDPEANSVWEDAALFEPVYEYFAGLSSTISELRFWGLLVATGGVEPCETNPLPVRIEFRVDSLGYPGYVFKTIDTSLVGTPGYLQVYSWGNFPQMEYAVQFTPPEYVADCWMSIMSRPESLCKLLWLTSNVGDDRSSVWMNGQWSHLSYDMSFCLVPCRIDEPQYFSPPFTYTGTTCGALKDCPLSIGEDFSILVDFDYYSWYDISLCGSPPWDSRLRFSYGSGCCYQDYAVDDNSCPDGQHPFITRQFMHNDDILITIDGATEFDCGEFTLTVTEALGRCCYFGPGEPWCGNFGRDFCDVLSGNTAFVPYLTCEEDPCPAPAACPPGSEISQPPEFWSFSSAWSDVGTGRRAFEYLYNLDAPVDSIRFWGQFFPRDGQFQYCEPTLPQSFLITFHADSLGWPGPALASHPVQLTGTPVYQFVANPERFLYEFVAAVAGPPVSECWIGIASNGFDPEDDCVLFWLSSPLGDEQSVVWNSDGGWQMWSVDLSICLNTAFAAVPADSLTAIFNKTEQWIELRWHAPVNGWWTVYKSADVNAVYPDGYTNIASSLFGPGTGIAYDPDLSTPHARYVVVLHSGPPGR